jgi:hypothetical protein
LSWEAASDNVAAKGYRILRDGKQIADLPALYTSWVDLQTAPDQRYEYAIRAYDDAKNLSEASSVVISTAGFAVPPQAAAEAVKPATRKPGNLAQEAKIQVSSEYSDMYGGANLADGRCGENDVGEWAAKGERRPWLRLEWKKPVTIGKVVLYDRANPSDHAKAGRLTFSAGEPREVKDIPNDGSPHTITFDHSPRKATWMKFEVTDSSGANIGLSEIEVLGAE